MRRALGQFILFACLAGCAADARRAVDLHAPFVIDEAAILKRYGAECQAGDAFSCAQLATHADLVDAAGRALLRHDATPVLP